ncbi:MAG TPA: dTDP-glucose 4,6-dehydratase [Longimicrobiales bacterium]
MQSNAVTEAQHMPGRLLVTGAAGFIGANFVRYWLGRYPDTRIVALDALTYAGNPASLVELNDRVRFIHGDIADDTLVESLLHEEAIDTIVHFAAESHVDRSIHGPDAFLSTNVIGTHALLKAARRAWLSGSPRPHRFHHVSTDEVYGSLGPADPAFTEATPYAPNSPYSASKASSDHLVRAYHHTYGLDVVTSNCSNNYGPFQFPEKLIPLIIVNILEGRPLPVYGDGLNVRDWLYVEDHCAGIDLCITRGRAGETYNLGGRNEWTNIDIVRTLCGLLDERFAADSALAARFPGSPCARGVAAESLITFVRDRPGHDRRYAIDTTRAERELGYAPQQTFATGIGLTVDWYLANEAWWRGVMDGSYRTWMQTNYA